VNASSWKSKAKKGRVEASKKLPGPQYGGITGKVALSTRDKAPEILLSDDQMTCTGSGGYRMVRATHGVHVGAYFWEAEISSSTSSASVSEAAADVECRPHSISDAHIRLGWSTRQGPLQAPVGYDKNSFAYRDIDGNYTLS
jgi:Set1/Ash2 histone methyltransferase complex subunit ASH2